ncbi:HpsJ family protein [Acaryochloris sp. IP29b_bin.148]|uniref:HpsJ family protein n=1 Tax=Acaryochloris sp. IP29b_bin.148 TaxID=2969218 RepID=UPI00261EB12D|nr:HpsJ family protein [Acaryochloris sp. IP29b_bin.148]
MTVSENRPNLPPSSRVLTGVGLVLVLTFFLDFVVRLMSPQLFRAKLQQPEAANAELLQLVERLEIESSQVNLLHELSERGVIPLIGLALIYAGFWFYRYSRTASVESQASPKKLSAWQDSKFWTFVFASLLGLMFLLIIPFHFSKTGNVSKLRLDIVEREWTQTKTVMDQQLNQIKLEEQQWQQIGKDPTQLDQLLQSPQLPPQQKTLLTQLKENPQALKQTVDARTKQLQQQQTQGAEQLAKAEQRKAEVVSQTEGERNITRLRVAIRSTLLAVGFASIGWTGLRDSSN